MCARSSGARSCGRAGILDKHFHGTDDQRRWLEERRPQFLARWDELPKTFCHHQKSWIVDAGTPDAVGFVGGINLLRDSIVPPGHPPLEGGESTHDVYLEIRGPCTTDVQHNFVQRWNGASLRSARDGAWPDPEATTDLEFPRSLAAPAGDVEAQITRTMRREAYRDGVAAVGGRETAIERGEKSALEQYVRAIDAARRTIYVEDQTIASLKIMTRLEAALGRGVAVGYLVPARANRMFAASRGDPRSRPMFEKLARLGEHERFTLLGITSSAAPGRYVDIYVHAKIMLVDDEWATIGSTNVADRSIPLRHRAQRILLEPGGDPRASGRAPARAHRARHRRPRRRRVARLRPRTRARQQRTPLTRRSAPRPRLRPGCLPLRRRRL